MKKWLVIVTLLLAVPFVFAANTSLCSDTDGGGGDEDDAAIKVKGSVKYGITSMEDTCLTATDGVSTASGKWLREYFCYQDHRNSETYDCVKLGGNCVQGACNITGTATNGSGSSTPKPVAACGNKILEKDKGEQCDPPGSICFGKTTAQYGSCQSDCKCKISGSAEQPKAVCGDSALDSGEECEKDSDCDTSYVCSSCKCVKQLTAEEIEAMKKSAEKEDSEKEDDVKKEIEKELGELPEVNLSAEDFTDSAAIKATSGITGFFKGIFGWIASIFS